MIGEWLQMLVSMPHLSCWRAFGLPVKSRGMQAKSSRKARTRRVDEIGVGVLLLMTVGCSSDGQAGAATAEIAIPVECRGFEMENIRYSPGGSALPNTCKPFDPTTNNPYAVRCIDVLPGYRTRYPGDEFCILPPPPERGAQVGVHPQGLDYWNQMWAGNFGGYSNDSVSADFEVAPGDEVEATYTSTLGNAQAESWYRVDSRMRTGSHHLASYKTSNSPTYVWQPFNGLSFPDGADGGFLWNAQRTDANRPVNSLEIPTEDAGLGSPIGAQQSILIDVHHFNVGDSPILREVWINLWWVEGTATQTVQDLPLVAPVSVPPNAITILEGSFPATQTTRVLSLFGHRHAWTRRFNAWIHRTDGSDVPVYDSFNWAEVPTFAYDSHTQNPVADPATQKDGAYSGLLTLAPGDVLYFNCHVDTTAAHAAELGVPVPTESLVFGNKAFDAEMCILYAQVVTP